ncbi:BON domain-containing protein [Lysobacter sp. A286]
MQDRNRNVGNDLKAMAQDVVDMGAQWVQSGREWMDERRDGMTNRNQAPHGSRRDQSQYRHDANPRSRADQTEREAGPGYAGAGPDTYLGENVTRHAQRYAMPGDTQPDYYDRPGYSQTAYAGADYRGPQRRSYSGMGPKNYVRSDSRINEDLCERLSRDHDVDASDIEVKVVDGTATLDGTVAQRWMKHRAEDLADGCSGVRHVENRIRVRAAADGDDRQPWSSGTASAQAAPDAAGSAGVASDRGGTASGSSTPGGSTTSG